MTDADGNSYTNKNDRPQLLCDVGTDHFFVILSEAKNLYKGVLRTVYAFNHFRVQLFYNFIRFITNLWHEMKAYDMINVRNSVGYDSVCFCIVFL